MNSQSTPRDEDKSRTDVTSPIMAKVEGGENWKVIFPGYPLHQYGLSTRPSGGDPVDCT